jgi:hypothetical protein
MHPPRTWTVRLVGLNFYSKLKPEIAVVLALHWCFIKIVLNVFNLGCYTKVVELYLRNNFGNVSLVCCCVKVGEKVG